eukprot:s739_g8.t1
MRNAESFQVLRKMWVAHVLKTLAEAKLNWKGDPRSAEGLEKFASHAFFMRRIVREPLTPSETATVAVAFSDLRARDLGLFNATTLGLCRRSS